MRRATVAAATFAIALLAGFAERAPGAAGVQLGGTFVDIVADPIPPDPVERVESQALPFSQTVSSGGVSVQQTTTFTDNGTAITLDSDHSLSATDGQAGGPATALSRLDQQFVVTAASVPVAISGSLSDSATSEQFEHEQTVEFRNTNGEVLFEFNDADDATFSEVGEVTPGTYVLEMDGICESRSTTESCASSLDVRLTLGGGACADVPMVGFAQPEGCFTETAPGSGVFETGEKAWIGGFEIVPRAGGKLVVDTVNRALSTTGAGADVVFAGFAVPIPVGAIPVSQQGATFEIGQPGSVISLLDLPLEASVKVSWAADGRSATYEQEVEVEELTEGIGELVTLSANESVGEASGKLEASLKNGEGFVLESAEIAIDEVNVVPRAFRLRKTLKLKNLLLKFERRADKPFWTGRAGITLPLAREPDLDVTGTVFAFDGDLAGGGFEVDGINKRVLGPFFLQKAGGDIAFVPIAEPPPGVIPAPEFGYDLRVGGTLGPRVGDTELVELDGSIQGGSLVADCDDSAQRPDPTKLQADVKLAPLKELEDTGLATVDIVQRACVYPGTGAAAVAIEGTLEGEISFLDVFAYKGTQTGFISSAGASYEGAVELRLPALPDLDGSAIVSTVGIAACADLTFFEGGFGHAFGSGAPSAFSGCDLGPFRVLQAPRPLAKRRGDVDALDVPAGLPHAGFAATGTSGPPPVTLGGPGGLTVTSPADGSALTTANAVIVPVTADNTTYVFVDNPKAGPYQLTSTDPANPVTQVRFAEGLPDPKVKGKVATGKKRFRLTYSLREIEGQRVTLYERGEGIGRRLGKAKGDGGTLTFKPTIALDRKRTIEAEVIQNGLPRELITVAKFKAPKLPKLKAPKPKAKRTKKSMKLSWAKVVGAGEYLIEVKAGTEVLYRVVTKKRKLRFSSIPKQGKLKVSVQALSEIQPAGPVAKLQVKPSR
jgi:hypothetical protein